MQIKAILSTTVLPIDGTYKVETVGEFKTELFAGIQHFVGHPDTKEIVESFGAIQAESKLFAGLQVGESAVCVPIQQGKSTRSEQGFTTPHQNVTTDVLEVRIITRLA